MQAEWRHEDTGKALTPGAQESNDIDYVLEQAHERGEQLTVRQWLDKFSSTNEPKMKALRHLGYSVSNGYWQIAGAPHSEKLKRDQRREQVAYAEEIIATCSNEKIFVVRKRVRKSVLRRSD
jgi:hypothetical protein